MRSKTNAKAVGKNAFKPDISPAEYKEHMYGLKNICTRTLSYTNTYQHTQTRVEGEFLHSHRWVNMSYRVCILLLQMPKKKVNMKIAVDCKNMMYIFSPGSISLTKSLVAYNLIEAFFLSLSLFTFRGKKKIYFEKTKK